MKLIDKNFYYSGVEVDYDREYHCQENGCDSICRCSTIVNTKIESIDMNSVTDTIYSLYFDNSNQTKRDLKLNTILNQIDKNIDLYTIDRILRINQIWNSDSWEIYTENSYYGEEIESVVIEGSIAQKVEDLIEQALLIEDLDKRIEYLLKLEYGYILPELIGKNYKAEIIEKDQIIFGSDGHYRKIQTEDLEHYSDINFSKIRGIVLKKDNMYKLIDGYHRCFKSDTKRIKVLIAY